VHIITEKKAYHHQQPANGRQLILIPMKRMFINRLRKWQLMVAADTGESSS